MDSMRKTALVAGILYLITFISVPALHAWAVATLTAADPAKVGRCR